MSGAKAKEADPILLKAVLELIEERDLRREEWNGIDRIFKENENFFPTHRRAALRRKWDDLRRQSVENYHKFLLQSGVSPGAGTTQELLDATIARTRRGQ